MADDEPKYELAPRKDALALGLKHYFTGLPCERGHVSRRYTSGLRCVDCATEQRKKWRADNPQRSRELRMEWARKNPERERASQKKSHARPEAREAANRLRREARAINPEKVRAKQRACVALSYARNPAPSLARSRKWALNNPDKIKEARRRANDKWVAKNPLAPRAKAARRRSWKLRAGGTYTQADVLEILKMQRGRCAYCRKKVGDDFHVDHIVALAKGGSNGRSNLQITCPPCNLTKSAHDPISHARTLGLLL